MPYSEDKGNHTLSALSQFHPLRGSALVHLWYNPRTIRCWFRACLSSLLQIHLFRPPQRSPSSACQAASPSNHDSAALPGAVASLGAVLRLTGSFLVLTSGCSGCASHAAGSRSRPRSTWPNSAPSCHSSPGSWHALRNTCARTAPELLARRVRSSS